MEDKGVVALAAIVVVLGILALLAFAAAAMDAQLHRDCRILQATGVTGPARALICEGK